MLSTCLIQIGISQPIRAQNPATTQPPPPAETTPPPETISPLRFGGISLGVGLSLTHDTGKNDRITRADLVNGIVRVEEQRNDLARFMFEAHYFFTPNFKLFGVDPYAWGTGPFVAIEPGADNKVINAIGLGWMIGFRTWTYDWATHLKTWNNTSWNIGVGFAVDPTSKILGDGIRANQPLPPGETAIRLKDTSQGGIMIITSFAFN
jgi:hypothetical protein